MNIIIFGAGAIGSLFGFFLAKNNNVILIGRKEHVKAIKKNGLKITGKTQAIKKINAETKIENIHFNPDLLIITVKSYDTEKAIKISRKIIKNNTKIITIQNGLDNIEKIKNHTNKDKIIAGITTYAALIQKPGVIKHTGNGETILGLINKKKTKKIEEINKIFNQSGIKTKISKNIKKEIWEKAIINSSINPITTIFNCKNGYLQKNLILKKLIKKTCRESTNIANTQNINLSHEKMYKKTLVVINNTKNNRSSMLQDFMKNKKTEIDSINNIIVKIGKMQDKKVFINDSLVKIIKNYT